MKQIIERIYKRTTEYSHPSQATTIANSLELLSSGIYTEEERFIFELLQNAVDSYDDKSGGLDVRIVIGNGQLAFMHTGNPFSERDLEGLCDIGNGNKMSDAKKIGYKGIGFKSVFMHSKKVTVVTGNTCFRFDEEACKEIASKRGSDYQGLKMPWQIIPILSDIPQGLDYNDYNVATILEVPNTEKLLKKVEKLLSDARFLLFLKVANLRVSLFDNNRELLSLSKTQEGNILTLAKNEVAQSCWLMFAEDVKIPAEVKEDLIHDVKTPAKLKDSDSVEISFAIALDDNGKISPLKDSVVYTYLPTSFSFGFEFVVNANFITDAGRQQLIKDCEWNKFIFSQIPSLFLNWIKDGVAPNHEEWYRVLLPQKCDNDDLSLVYASSLKFAIESIPFVRSLQGKQCLISKSIFDKFAFHKSIKHEIFSLFVSRIYNISNAYDAIIPLSAGNYLTAYGVPCLDKDHIETFLEQSEQYLTSLNEDDFVRFINWLKLSSSFDSILAYSRILPCEDGQLHEPVKSFFPSDFVNNTEIAEDALVLKPSFMQLVSTELIAWLKDLGVQEMSKISIIDKVICESGYITAENAIKSLRFVFEANKTENVFGRIAMNRLENLKLLTIGGHLLYASEVYLSDRYNPICKLQNGYPDDIFVTDAYITSNSEIPEWMFFLKKLGVKDDVYLHRVKYGEGSWAMKNNRISSLVSLAKRTEYNPWGARKYYLGCGGPVSINVISHPLLTPTINLQHEFYTIFWGRIFSQTYNREKETIYGPTGYGWSKSVSLDSTKYLGQSFIGWIISSFQVIPASDQKLYKIQEVLINSDINRDLFGKYFPVLEICGAIADEWLDWLPLKEKLTLNDYLEVLDKISKDDSKDQIKENVERITRIYDRIADGGYDLLEGSSDFNILRNWGKCHKILSTEKEFKYPSDLYLLPSRLSGVELDNQVYHRKNQENNRFADLMIALGVNMINDHRVEGLDYAEAENSVRKELSKRIEFFTALTLKDNDTIKEWEEALQRMQTAISNMNFFKLPSIQVVYGDQRIKKKVYVKDSNFYFVGKFGLAIQELLHTDIVRLLGLHANDRSIFLTLMRMLDHEEMIEYLQMKGYNTHYISYPQVPAIQEPTSEVSMGGEEASLGGLTTEQMRDALSEAKDAVLKQLQIDGFDVSNHQWDGWTCIDGVRKGATEFPLVIRSNKSGSNIRLNSIDWNQLMKPNAIFAMNTSEGIGTLNLKDVLKSRENITVRFKSDNIDKIEHVSKIANLLAYFRGIQFDFESYVRPTISRWQTFLAPELQTGEQAKANTSIPLPD